MKKIVTTMTMLTLMTACSSDGAGARAEAADDVATGFEIQYTTPVPSEFFQAASQQGTIELLEYVNDLIPAVETHYSTYLESPTEAGILASRSHRAIGGFSLGSITTWYVFEQAFPYSKFYLPMSGDNWSQGMYGGAYYPDATAQFLADLVNASPYRDDFYVWYAVGTNDVRLDQTHNQALAMAKLTDTFNASNFSYHMKEGGQHDFNAVWEFCYHALQFFFPKSGEATAVSTVRSGSTTPRSLYSLSGTRLRQAPQRGIYIADGRKIVR